MASQAFDRLYKKLNPAQKLAVDTIEGAVMVVAGPGTGKTTTLTLRIANILLKTQVNPENILALTFTEAAAYEMRKRLLDIIGQDAYRVEITTFHSFCNNFIRAHQEEFSNIVSSDNITEIEQVQIIESIIKKEKFKFIKPLGDLIYYVKPALSAISALKMENVSPESFEATLGEQEKFINSLDDLRNIKGKYKGQIKGVYKKKFKEIDKNKELLKVYSEYQKRLVKEKKYDYDDMLLEVIKQLQVHPYLLQYLQEKFQYFLVDEHQDTNASQNKIVEMLTSFFDNPNLFIVGDEKQAIYRFQGASLENFLYFKKKYPNAVLINLSENYRSTQTILDATYSLISNNIMATEVLSERVKLVKRASQEEEKLKKIEFNTYDGEYYWTAQKIKELLKTTNANNIAVLVRNNDDLNPLIPILDKEKILYVVESNSNVLDDIEIQKLILLLRAVNKPAENSLLLKAMLLECFDIQPLDVFKISRERYTKKNNTWDIVESDKNLESLGIKDKKAIKNFSKLFSGEDGFIKKAYNARFDEVFVEVFNKSGLLSKILEKPNAQEILMRFARLYDEVKLLVGRDGSYNLQNFVDYIDLLEKHKIALKRNTHIIPTGVVRLMTAHKAKGLEFDYVFVLNAFNTHWGNKIQRGAKFDLPWDFLGKKLTENIEDKNEDERRLFYVALTRARKSAFITFSNSSVDGREQIISQFLTEIPEQFIENIDSSAFEKQFNKKLQNLFKIGSEKANSFTKEFVSEIFKRQGLSVSALNNYLECPWKYFFINLVRIPEKIDDSGLFGNAIHEAISKYITAFKKGKADKKILIDSFENSEFLKSIAPNELERFVERGEKALPGFYDEKLKFLKTDVETEVDIKGIRLTKDIILNGKIDLIEPLNKNNFVDVYDFKTGGIKSRNEIEGLTKNSDGNYKRQLVFYKILLNSYRNNFFKMKNGIIEFIEPNENGVFKREIFLVTDSEEKDLITQIKEVGQKILEFSFINERCEKRDCEYCRLKQYLKISV